MNMNRIVDGTTQSNQVSSKNSKLTLKFIKEDTKTIIASVLKMNASHLITITTNQMSILSAYTNNWTLFC